METNTPCYSMSMLMTYHCVVIEVVIKPFWAKLRETVKIEEETFIDDSNCVLILGRRHFIQRQEDRTRCVFDMRPYTEGVVDAYCEMTGFEEVTIETSKEMLEVSS